jgi:hypothetical protein
MPKTEKPAPQGEASAFFDPSKLIEQMAMPGFDLATLMEAQRKNLEAIMAANQRAVEGIRALTERQADLMRQAMEEAAKVARELATAGTPEEVAAKQAELMKEAYEMAVASATARRY